MPQQRGGQIDTVMHETRLFPPPAEFAARARIGSLAAYEKLWHEAAADIEGFWGRAGRRAALVRALPNKCSTGKSRSPSGSSAARPTPRTTASIAHLSTPVAEQGRHHLGRRAGRQRHAHLSAAAPRSLQIRQRAQVAGHHAGRRRVDLHADGARAGHRHAGLRRIGAVHSVIFGGFSSEAIADRNNDAQAKLHHHGRRRLAARAAVAAEEQRRRGAGQIAHGARSASCCAAPAATVHMQPGRDLWWHDLMAERLGRLPGRAARQRNAAVHPLHQRLDRQAQGHQATPRPATTCSPRKRSSGSSTIAMKTSFGVRPIAAGSPGTATSSTARCRPAPRW